MNWKESLQKIRWKKKFREFLEIASDASEIIVHLRNDPKPYDYAAIGLKIANSWVRHTDKKKSRPFKGWNRLDIWEYKDFIYDIAKQDCEIENLHEDDDGKHIITEINGIKFGWEDYSSDRRIYGPFVEKHVKRSDYMSALGKLVWDHLGTNACEIDKKKGIVEDDYGDGITIFKADKQENIHKSKVADEILERSMAFLKNNYNRSIMLYGIPGTGKSSAMRYVAKEFGEYSLRINIGDLDSLSSDDMLLAIEMLKPSTLMIDDFDRTLYPTKFLTELEKFNNHVQLFMVSVNYIERLDDAVIRPQRFDDIIEVSMLDKEIVDKLVGDGIPDNVKERLCKLPISYVIEFHKRRKVLGLEKALEEVVDLESRIRNLRETAGDPERSTKKRRKKRKKKKTGKKSTKPKKLVEVDVIEGEEPND